MRARSAKAIVGAITAIGLLLTASGCGSTAQSNGDTETKSDIRFYGSDGNMANSFGEALKDSPAR